MFFSGSLYDVLNEDSDWEARTGILKVFSKESPPSTAPGTDAVSAGELAERSCLQPSEMH